MAKEIPMDDDDLGPPPPGLSRRTTAAKAAPEPPPPPPPTSAMSDRGTPRVDDPRDESREDPRDDELLDDTAIPVGLRRKRTQADDKFYVSPHRIPTGWSYEWKRYSVYNMTDPSYLSGLSENHWTPVPSARHPELVPDGHKGHIIRDGMILMQRPKYLTDDARREDIQMARESVRVKEQQLSATPSGTMERIPPKLKRSYMPLEVPADEEAS